MHRYYEVPEEVLEDRDVLTTWAQEAVAAAMRPKNPHKPKPRPNAKPKTKKKSR